MNIEEIGEMIEGIKNRQEAIKEIAKADQCCFQIKYDGHSYGHIVTYFSDDDLKYVKESCVKDLQKELKRYTQKVKSSVKQLKGD